MVMRYHVGLGVGHIQIRAPCIPDTQHSTAKHHYSDHVSISELEEEENYQNGRELRGEASGGFEVQGAETISQNHIITSSGYDPHGTEHETNLPANSGEESDNDDELEGSGFGEEPESEAEFDFDDSGEELGSGDGSEEGEEGEFECWNTRVEQGLVDDYEN
jgi:hypothetical protein